MPLPRGKFLVHGQKHKIEEVVQNVQVRLTKVPRLRCRDLDAHDLALYGKRTTPPPGKRFPILEDIRESAE